MTTSAFLAKTYLAMIVSAVIAGAIACGTRATIDKVIPASGATSGQPSSGDVSAPTAVALTVYNDNLALVQETRAFQLRKGRQALAIDGVSSHIEPETVHLRFKDAAKFTLLEQNFDYDLLSADKLLERCIGRELGLIDPRDGSREKVTLLSLTARSNDFGMDGSAQPGLGGDQIFRTADGRILLNPPGQVELPRDAGAGLQLHPTLSWALDSPAPGRHEGEVSYLTSGLSWSADYVLMLNADETSAGLESWVTLNNTSGASYKDAQLKLVAGDIHHVKRVMQQMNQNYDSQYSAAARSADQFKAQPLFEYQLYDLQRVTEIRDQQQKQIGLLSAANIPVQKVYEFDGKDGGGVRAAISFRNDTASGLGKALPAGKIRLFMADNEGLAQFIGEDDIAHTPRDEDISLTAGNAFDITGEVITTDFSQQEYAYRATNKVVLKNHKVKTDVTITVKVALNSGLVLTHSDCEYVRKDAYTIEYRIPVKAGGKTAFSYSYALPPR